MSVSKDSNLAAFATVAGARPDATGNLTVKVVEAKTVVDRPTWPGGKPQKIAECLIGDDTGTILFSGRNEQLDLLKPGSYLTLTNAKVDMFKGNMRVVVNQFGKVERCEGANFEAKLENNMSLIEFELVPLPEEKVVAVEITAAEAPEGVENGVPAAAAQATVVEEGEAALTTMEEDA